jgi:hypothetical protein
MVGEREGSGVSWAEKRFLCFMEMGYEVRAQATTYPN